MKKTMLILAATMAMGTAAIAQDTSTTGAPTQGAPDAAAPATPTDTTTTPDQSGTTAAPQGTPDPSMGATPPATGQMATPPAADAGGMTPPASGGMAQSTQPTGDYPACGRGVTDKCVQKGGMHTGAAHRTHHRAHHKK